MVVNYLVVLLLLSVVRVVKIFVVDMVGLLIDKLNLLMLLLPLQREKCLDLLMDILVVCLILSIVLEVFFIRLTLLEFLGKGNGTVSTVGTELAFLRGTLETCFLLS